MLSNFLKIGIYIPTKCRKIIYFLSIFLVILLSFLYAQVWDFKGEGNIDTSYVFVFGNKDIFSMQNSFYEGLNYNLKGKISLNQITDRFSINLNYITGYNPQDQISLKLRTENLEGIFSNNFQESLSYLTLWNKNVNGVEIKYFGKDYSIKGFLAKVESTKKQKSFYGNDTLGPYILGDFYLVPGKEKVYLNGKLLERDLDYIIDYTYGILYFVDIISSDDIIIVEYEVRGIQPQIYNLLGLKIDISPLSLSFLSLDDPSFKINRKFIDLSLLTKKNENFLELSISQGLINDQFMGRGYNLSFNYKGENFNITGKSIKIDENYPYFKEILGNFEILPGILNNLSLNIKPYAFLSYSLNLFTREDKSYKQSLQNNLSLELENFALSGIWNKDIDIGIKENKGLTLRYKKIPSSFYIREELGEKKEIIKGISINPQFSPIKLDISYQIKDTYSSDILLLNQSINKFLIDITYTKFSISLGESYERNNNFRVDMPLSLSQLFITDGYQAYFTLTYTPIPNTIEVYINGVFVENGGTFTYYIPLEEPITYTVEYSIIDKTLQIFFIDNYNKIPPPSGLTLMIKYKYYLPQESYLKRNEFAFKLKINNINFSSKGTIFEKDGKISRILNLSLYGEILPKFWSNISYFQNFDENKKNLSLNISYKPSNFETLLGYNYQEDSLSILKNIYGSSKINMSFGVFQGEFSQRDSLFSNYYLSIRNYKLSCEFKISDIKFSISYFNEERKSPNISLYLSNSYSLSLLREIEKLPLKFTISKEEYSDLSFKYKNLLEIFPLKGNNSKIFLENIYYQKGDNFYSSWRIGSQISIYW